MYVKVLDVWKGDIDMYGNMGTWRGREGEILPRCPEYTLGYLYAMMQQFPSISASQKCAAGSAHTSILRSICAFWNAHGRAKKWSRRSAGSLDLLSQYCRMYVIATNVNFSDIFTF